MKRHWDSNYSHQHNSSNSNNNNSSNNDNHHHNNDNTGSIRSEHNHHHHGTNIHYQTRNDIEDEDIAGDSVGGGRDDDDAVSHESKRIRFNPSSSLSSSPSSSSPPIMFLSASSITSSSATSNERQPEPEPEQQTPYLTNREEEEPEENSNHFLSSRESHHHSNIHLHSYHHNIYHGHHNQHHHHHNYHHKAPSQSTVVLFGFGDDSIGQLGMQKYMIVNSDDNNRDNLHNNHVNSNNEKQQQQQQKQQQQQQNNYCCTPSIYDTVRLFNNDYEQLSHVFVSDSCSFFKSNVGRLKTSGDTETCHLFHNYESYMTRNRTDDDDDDVARNEEISSRRNICSSSSSSMLNDGAHRGPDDDQDYNLHIYSKCRNSTIRKIASGTFFFVILTWQYDIFVTGDNESGNLGVGSFDNVSTLVPLDLSSYAPSIDRNSNPIVDVACGEYFSLFRTRNGTVWSCGSNEYGQLGCPRVHKFSNVLVPVDMDYGSMMRKMKNVSLSRSELNGGGGSGGSSWSENESLGNVGSRSSNSSSSSSSGSSGSSGGGGISGVSVGGDGCLVDEKIEAMVCGANFHVLVSNCGNAWVCGDNIDGQIGMESHVKKVARPTLLSQFRNNVQSVACGYQHMILLTRDHQLYACGANAFGQTGLCRVVDPGSTPIFGFRQLPDCTETGFQTGQISKIVCSGNRSFFISRYNELWACGYNRNGQLGLGHDVESVHVPSVVDYRTSLRRVREREPRLVPSTRVVHLDIVASLDHNLMVVTVSNHHSLQYRLWQQHASGSYSDVNIVTTRR